MNLFFAVVAGVLDFSFFPASLDQIPDFIISALKRISWRELGFKSLRVKVLNFNLANVE